MLTEEKIDKMCALLQVDGVEGFQEMIPQDTAGVSVRFQRRNHPVYGYIGCGCGEEKEYKAGFQGRRAADVFCIFTWIDGRGMKYEQIFRRSIPLCMGNDKK